MQVSRINTNVPESMKHNNVNNRHQSFKGSVAGLADAVTNKGLIGKVAKGVEFNGLNLSFPLLVATMSSCVAFRLKNAKDKYDREEILRRDVISCSALIFGEKMLRKGFSKANENKSGFVLAAKDKGFQAQSGLKRFYDYIRPIKGVKVLGSDQIVSKYSNIGNYKEGVKGFCDFISGQGGNLGKVFSLTDESRALVQSILPEGQNIASANNECITQAIDKAKDSESVKKLVDLFKDKNNPWVTKAKTLNARFTALSVLVIVPFFLGFFLPWLNEKITKKKFKEEHAIKEKPANQLNIAKLQSPKIFSNIENFEK